MHITKGSSEKGPHCGAYKAFCTNVEYSKATCLVCIRAEIAFWRVDPAHLNDETHNSLAVKQLQKRYEELTEFQRDFDSMLKEGT